MSLANNHFMNAQKASHIHSQGNTQDLLEMLIYPPVKLPSIHTLMVSIQDINDLNTAEENALRANCIKHNMAFYRLNKPCTRSDLFTLWNRLGLHNLINNPESSSDGISEIKVNTQSRYIPYTHQALQWHTDGYYNTGQKSIRAFAMHCVHPATTGGMNTYYNPDTLIAQLFKKDPRWVAALMHPKAMTIPANTLEDRASRCEVTTPILSIEEGRFLLRYTERAHAIVWNTDPILPKVRAYAHDLLANTSAYHLSYNLQANEGVICNNVLHCRSAFKQTDGSSPRLLYRARFHQRVS